MNDLGSQFKILQGSTWIEGFEVTNSNPFDCMDDFLLSGFQIHFYSNLCTCNGNCIGFETPR